jgi:hypothetical protein
MLPRLDPKDQRTVDQMWNNMLTPVARVDHQTLLDANIAYWMFSIGVDRMYMRGEKYFDGGTVVMEMDCDRANPDVDQFTITIVDQRGRTVRRERYSRAEVEESTSIMRGIPNLGPTELNITGTVTINIGNPTTEASTQPVTPPATTAATVTAETPQERRFREEAQRRQAAAAAATQPAITAPHR